jgi:hypothetical protein
MKQKEVMKDVQNVKELLESGEESNNKLLKSSLDSLDRQLKLQSYRIEIFQSCKSNPMGILHPRIGLSESSLSWYDVIRNPVIQEMQDFDNFLRQERTFTSGSFLPLLTLLMPNREFSQNANQQAFFQFCLNKSAITRNQSTK